MELEYCTDHKFDKNIYISNPMNKGIEKEK
jgi:hypothetical protein